MKQYPNAISVAKNKAFLQNIFKIDGKSF